MAAHDDVEKVARALRDNMGGYFYAMYNARDDDAQAVLKVAARAAIAAIAAMGEGWQDIASARAAALEEAAVIAETWFDHHRPQQPKKSRFNIYDIEHWAKSATRLVAEDIRARAALAQGGEKP